MTWRSKMRKTVSKVIPLPPTEEDRNARTQEVTVLADRVAEALEAQRREIEREIELERRSRVHS